MIDAHAHLADPAFDADRAEVLARAEAAGVTGVVTVSETLADAERVLELARLHSALLPAAGLYPAHLDPEQASRIEQFITRHRDRLVAVGEVGLDRWVVRDQPGRELQREIFLGQVRLAIDLDLPLNVHSRSAGARTIAALKQAGARRVLLHAFDGRAAVAREGLAAGYFFSIPPSLVRSRQKQKLVAALPLEALLLETDSPVLGAQPGERNEPARLPQVAREIAAIKGIDAVEVEEVTTRNARALFGLT